MNHFLDVTPTDEGDVIVDKRLLEFGAGDDIEVALPPSCAVIGMVHGDGLKFGVVVAEVHDQFGDARFQVADQIQIESFPIGSGHAWSSDLDRVQDCVFGRKLGAEIWRGFRAERGEKWQFVFVSELYVDRDEIGAREEYAHVAVEVCGTNAHRDGAVDLRAEFALRVIGFDVLRGRTSLGPEVSGGIEETRDIVGR